jgi:hypothetical protein
MADGIPSGGPPRWDNLVYLFAIAAFGWFGDWLRVRWQSRKPPPPEARPHRRHDDDWECDCGHHHHRASDEDEEG